MIALAELWTTWSTPAGAVIGGALTWTGTFIKARLQQQRNTLDAGQQALEVVRQSQRQQAMLAAALERAIANECSARAREVATADMVQDLHIDLIGARLRCHDVEMRFGLEPTVFPLIPAFPWRISTENAPDASDLGRKEENSVACGVGDRPVSTRNASDGTGEEKAPADAPI